MKDPNDRRRIPQEQMNRRDAEVARMRRAGVPFRAIAERLNMSLGAVQKAVKRGQKIADAAATGEPANVLVAVDDKPTADDVRTVADVARLRANTLELYRLTFVPDLPVEVRAATVSAWQALPREPVTYPITDDDGQSWREGVDRALSDDSGTDGGGW